MLADQKRILVNAFTRYRIVDPLRFFQSVRIESTLRARLGTVTNSVVREVLGNATFAQVLSAKREELLGRIVENLNVQSNGFGIEIVDVRLRRTDLPDEVSERVYARMQSEREREAKEIFELVKRTNIVLATGGGAVTREDVRKAILEALAEYHRPLALMLQATPEVDSHRAEADIAGVEVWFEAVAFSWMITVSASPIWLALGSAKSDSTWASAAAAASASATAARIT